MLGIYSQVDLAYQVLKIADYLTNNKEDFALYLIDVTFDNFVVDAAGKVKLVDLEDIIVVDKQAVKAGLCYSRGTAWLSGKVNCNPGVFGLSSTGSSGFFH